MDSSILARVEQQRVELETKIAKFKKALRHWQILEIDYEGLKEEFQLLPAGASRSDCVKAAQDFGAELVDEKELQSLLGDTNKPFKSPAHLIETLSKRVEYVSRNIDTLKRQLSDAEKKRNALLLAEEPEFRDEAGLPLTEITEELDEDGRVLSSKLQLSGSAAPQLLDVLKKAGVKGIGDEDSKEMASSPKKRKVTAEQSPPPIKRVPQTSSDQAAQKLVFRPKQVSDGARNQPLNPASFTDDYRPSEETLTQENSSSSPNRKNQSKIPASVEDDSEEDAALRQEMLQYGLGEVGAIVAELDLEDDVSYGEEDNDDLLDMDSDFDEDDSIESDDESGLAKHPIIPASYQRKMELLSKKHGISGMSNVGPSPTLPEDVQEQLDKLPAAEAARKAALARAEASAKAVEQNAPVKAQKPKPTKKTKKVAFANDLDIASETPKQTLGQDPITGANVVKSIGDAVIERSNKIPAEGAVFTSSPPAKKVSRFKSARAEAPQTPIFTLPAMDFPRNEAKGQAYAPVGKIFEPAIIERPENHDSENTASAPDPDEIDETLHRREIATEYQKMRNRMIHQQGGYVREGEEGNYGDATAPLPVEDEEIGQVKKISRFKAAKMQ